MIKPYQIKNPIEIETELRQITDLYGHPIDKGIYRSVVILNSLGFTTSGSCEGHQNEYNSNPYIDIIFQTDKVDNFEECKKLFFQTLFIDLNDFYKNRVTPHDRKIVFIKYHSLEFEIRLFINTNLKVFGEERDLELQKHFQELTEFCEFLNKKYNLNY